VIVLEKEVEMLVNGNHSRRAYIILGTKGLRRVK